LINERLNENLLREYSPVVLAYIGDAVFELMVRTHMVCAGNNKIHNLHLSTVELVQAKSQACIVRYIFPLLTEKEQDIVKRGRNAKGTVPKNADPAEYSLSTGFEALLGYLYLQGNEERLNGLVKKILQHAEGN
jgi:ribonuclease-3 family protein